MINTLLILLIPFLGTTLGSAVVFLIRVKLNVKIEKLFLGFAGGVMFAASIWSLIIPAIEQSENFKIPKWLPATIGILLGYIILILIDVLIKKIQTTPQTTIQKDRQMMSFVVALHNVPEGLAVGVALSGAYFGGSPITLVSAMMLAIGIAIQNFPEGAIISLPLKASGNSKGKSFFMGVLSGLVEPISGLIAFFITGFISSILPYVLAFSAGAMIFVVVRELIPEAQEDGFQNISTFGFFFGFLIMMILDVALR